METSGFIGQSCEEVIRSIALGEVEEKTYKESFYEVELVTQDTGY